MSSAKTSKHIGPRGGDAVRAHDSESPRHRREGSIHTKALGGLVFAIACATTSYVVTGTDEFKQVMLNFQAGIHTITNVDYTAALPPKLHCVVSENQHLNQDYARRFVASKLGHGTEHRSRPIYAMNVSCEQPIAKQALQNGVHINHLELISNHLFEGCLLLPADTTDTETATTQQAQAYCRLDLELT